MAGLFNTRNISFHTPKSEWDPIIRYYNSVLLGERRNIDLLPQVRVEPIEGATDKFVVQWSLGGFGDPIPGTPLREYSTPNLDEINQWLYSMEDTNIEVSRPYSVKSDGVGYNFPREIHNFALEALTNQGEILYGQLDAENVNDPVVVDSLDLPYWGEGNGIITHQHLADQFTRRQMELMNELARAREAEDQEEADRLEAAALRLLTRTERLLTEIIPGLIEANNNRPFWRVLREGSGGFITPDTVAIVYNQNNPPPNPVPEPYISPRTLGQALPTIFQMLDNIQGISEEQRRQNNALLSRAVREQLGINLEQRFNTFVSDNIPYPIVSNYYGSSIETFFAADGKSAKYLQIDNMSELAGSNYGLTKPVYNRYEPSLEAAESYTATAENNLIDFYALMGSINTDTVDKKLVPSGWVGTSQRGNFVYNKYKNISTLSGSVNTGILDISRQSLSGYYTAYMESIPSIEPGSLLQLSNLFKRSKFPDESTPFLTAYDFNQVLFPYYMGINFSSGETGEVNESINNNRASSYILDKIQKSEESMEPVVYTLSSDVIIANTQNKRNNSKDTSLRQHRFRDILEVSRNVGISDITFNTLGKEAITGDIAGGAQTQQFNRLLQTVQRESRKEILSYVDRIENKHFSSTEAIADVIEKRKNDSNTILSKNYIASPTIPEVFEYTDTQVKYKQDYQYEINRFQMAYGTGYSYKTLDITVPRALRQVSSPEENGDVSQQIFINYSNAGEAIPLVQDRMMLSEQVVGYSFIVEVNPTDARLLKLPIYNSIYDSLDENPAGVSFAPVSVRDFPPTPPVLDIQPIRDNFQQVLVNINLESVGRIKTNLIDGPQCLEGIDYLDTYEYQKMFIDFLLPDNKLVFQNDGLSEITNVTVVRTDKIVASAYESEDPYEVYKSFCGETNPEAEITRMSMDQDFGQVGAGSYGFLDDVVPNKIYYYTAYCKDLRENVSNPSDIYQVRLVYDKGFLVPEIGLLNVESLPNKVPVKKMTRFLEVRPSSIQTQPFMERNEDNELISYKSLISKAADAGILQDEQQGTVTANDFVVRITSKDTGRKIDIRLKVDETNPDGGDL